MRRRRTRCALLTAAFVITIAACGCAGGSSTSASSVTASPAATAASPAPVDLTLPTSIHPGNATSGGASLSEPSSAAKVSSMRALALNHLNPGARLTGTVLADVTMRNDFYRGRPIAGLTCWVYVLTFPKPVDPRTIGKSTASTNVTPASQLVQHEVFILDARNGQFVRGFLTK